MLQILPSSISNLIAAGEVVGRPASVVKELMENSIDAGAKSISVIILDAGRTMIQVIDDGCGMSPEDAVLCFARHATSKISSANDLEKISTFGFRGEALASIAAVAEVTLKTRRSQDEVGYLVELSESKVISQQVVSTPIGSNFSIRNIFYNVPARRKFLKSDISELRNIVSEFTRIALTSPGLSFQLTSNGKLLFDLRPVNNLKKRIHDIFGRDIIKELVDICTETNVVKVSGFIGKPEDARKTTGNQYFFINGRYFRSPYFHKAVCKPYEKLVPNGYTPSYFIYLETDYDKIDVNIHPTKTEVKFEDSSLIFDILMASVRESLGKNSFVPSIDFDTVGAPEIPAFSHSQKNTFTAPPKIDYDPLFNPFDIESSFESQKDNNLSSSMSAITPSGNYGRLFEDSSFDIQINLLQIQKKYIITPVKSGIMIINIERAKERIIYERYLEQIVEEQPLVQQSLFPQTIKLNTDDYLTIIGDLDIVSKLGFDIRDFGSNSIVVYGLPIDFSAEENAVKESIDALIASLKNDELCSDNKAHYAAELAKQAAHHSDKGMNANEAQMLVDQLFACRESSITPDGRKCMNIITIEELDNKL